MANKSVILKIKRQPTPTSKPHWEEFELAHHPGMNVISCLMEIAANPVTREGKPTTPITYDSNCLEEVCGSCAAIINGKGAFLAPDIGIVPLRRWPPIMRIRSMPPRLARRNPVGKCQFNA